MNIFPLSGLVRPQFKNAAYVNPNLRGAHVASDAHRNGELILSLQQSRDCAV